MNEEERKRFLAANSPEAYAKRRAVLLLLDCIPPPVKTATVERFTEALEAITKETGYRYRISKTPFQIAFEKSEGVAALTFSYKPILAYIETGDFDGFKQYAIECLREITIKNNGSPSQQQFFESKPSE